MIITFYGGEFFKLQFSDTVIALNPISKESKIASTRFGATIALSTINHPDMNGFETMSIGDKTPIVISSPGEYEVQGVFVRGFSTISGYDNKERINTVYVITLENINIAFLGALNTTTLPGEALEAMEEIDILFVPIGGDGVLDATQAYKTAVGLEPRIVIPMHYGSMGNKDALQNFLKEAGSKTESIPKLTIKRKDLEGKKAEVVVLESCKD